MPKIVVDDFGGQRSDPGMLGSGIYFASSARYVLNESYTVSYDTFIADPVKMKRGKQDSFPQILLASGHLLVMQISAIKFFFFKRAIKVNYSVKSRCL